MSCDIVLSLSATVVVLLVLHQLDYSWVKKVNVGIIERLLPIDSSKVMPLIFSFTTNHVN